MSLGPDKLKLVHVARRQLAMSEEHYRAVLEHAAGVRSAKDLDDPGFAAVLEEFKRLGFRGTGGVIEGYRPGMATVAQQGLILRLWKQLTGQRDKRKLGKWLGRRYHVSDLRFLEADVASKVILTLKAILDWKARRAAAGDGAESGRALP